MLAYTLPSTPDRSQWTFGEMMDYDRVKALVYALDDFGVASSIDRSLLDSYLAYFRFMER